MVKQLANAFIAEDKAGEKYIVLGSLDHKLLCQKIDNYIAVGDLKFIDAITLRFVKFYICEKE